MTQLIECVPNFSEGRDMEIIKQITNEIESVEGVSLLDVDPGAATNRTVVTIVGEPKPVIKAAFLAIKKAAELIDMSKHSGEHPRMGATDVCPMIPVSNISMEETVEHARTLAKMVGDELSIPIYCYENAAYQEKRRNLAYCRQGEYEALPDKLSKDEWKPDFGPSSFNAEAGATAIGARDFLVAFNVNLNTTSTRRANSVAFDLRERGRVKRDGDPITGKIVLDENGEKVWEPGDLKSVKAIGWYIEEYGIAQISMNLTNINICSVHKAFDQTCFRANERGIRVTGSELVGLVPKQAMLDAGKYFLAKQRRSRGVSESELIRIAIKSMGLDELKPFIPEEKIIEYVMAKDNKKDVLVSMNLKAFADETASESPAPGGGSISAYVGALGISLATMVANLSSHKRGWDNRWEEFSTEAEEGQSIKDQLIYLVDEDTNAFNKIMDAFGLPKKSEAEKEYRSKMIQEATKFAIEVPFKVMKLSFDAMKVIKTMAEIGNPNSVSDAGVGALCARTAVKGAFMNVRINAMDFEDKTYVEKIIADGRELERKAEMLEQEILNIVDSKINT